MREIPFKFGMSVDFFEKAGVAPEESRRIGGIASLETEDQDGETILQRGLDFSPFLKSGWFNDNHSKATSGVVGYPDKDNGVRYFEKGDKLPNGETAIAPGHWVEGYLIKGYDKADKIWELGKALRGTDRKLGFSVEGKVIQRTGPENKTITKALVRNVAVTHCPVNVGAQMDLLIKSMTDLESTDEQDLSKMLTVGAPPADHSAPIGPKTGEDAGQVLSEESLEDEEPKKNEKDEDEKDTEKSLSVAEAESWLKARIPGITGAQVTRFLNVAKNLKERKLKEF